MAFWFCFGLALLLSMLSTAKCNKIPSGALHMECHDRFFMIAVDLSVTGVEPHFEAVDETGVYPITEQNAAKCGYSVSVLPLKGLVELRASYFSCHTDNKDDEVFEFNFNLKAYHEGQEVIYNMNKTCSPSLPWSSREVTCEVNYMEVSVRNDVACTTGTKTDDGNATVQTAYTSAWQVTFQRAEQQMMPMNLSEAHKQGYDFELTDGRLVFRTPYGQPDSISTEVNGVPVEVVNATLFSRQSWIVLMVDLVAACSMYKGSYDSGYMKWETPGVLHPLVSGLHDTQVNIGINGELMEQSVAEERGYIVEKHNTTVQISIPYNAEGGYRKSLVTDALQEYYTFDLYLEQISVDEDDVDSRLRLHRTLATPLLPCLIFTENRTVQEERLFIIYLGNVPEDVALCAVVLNGHNREMPLNTSMHTITEVVHPNNTHGYTLKVPFDDPVVIKQFSKKDAAMQYRLDINYTLAVMPENQHHYHLASVIALTDASPPKFDAVCTELGISFKLDHRPFDYMWHIIIGSDLLTSKLAAQHGYIMRNNSQSLHLDVPLFTNGYEYKNFTLKGFHGSFEIFVRDRETSEIQSSTVKCCPFTTTELIMCSADGRMTVVADLSVAVKYGAIPAKTNLVDKQCRPREADDTKALFSVPLNSCGTLVKLRKGYVTYENEIFFSKSLAQDLKNSSDSSNFVNRLIVQCKYPLAGLHRLFSVYRFESDTVGVGSILHSAQVTEAQSPTVQPTKLHPTRTPATRRPKRPIAMRPVYHPQVQNIKLFPYLKKNCQEGSCKIITSNLPL